MRQGELLGLHWEDVDLNKGVLRVTSAIQFIAGRGLVESEPKTEKARRSIALPEIVATALHQHRVRQLETRLKTGKNWQDHGFVFTTNIGTPISPRNLLRHLHKTLAELGLSRLRFHDLRHTAATLLLSRGAHAKVVQEMLGHSQISLTLDTYSHVLPEMQKETAEKMGELLSN